MSAGFRPSRPPSSVSGDVGPGTAANLRAKGQLGTAGDSYSEALSHRQGRCCGCSD